MSDTETHIPTAEELAALKTQADILNGINETLNTQNELHESINNTLSGQSDLFQGIFDSYASIKTSVNDINTEFEKTAKLLETISKFDFEFINNNVTNTVAENINVVEESFNITYSNIDISLRNSKDNHKLFMNRQIATNDALKAVNDSEKEKMIQASKNSRNNTQNIQEQAEKISKLKKGWNWLKEKWQGFWGSIAKNLKNIRDLLHAIGKYVVAVGKTAVSSAMQMTKALMTLPFTIAKIGAEVGGELRELFDVKMAQTQEDLKEKFSMSSYIGKQIGLIRNSAESAVLAFKRPTSEYVKLFGFGAEGMQKFISSYGDMVDSIGYFGEVYAGEIQNNFMTFTKLKLAAGYSAEDMKYLALDAYTSSSGLGELMFNTFNSIRTVAKQQNLDEKLLSKGVMTLRKDIVLFGHISTTELANTAAVITKMGVRMEDASAVFNKFSTFEEASNAAAILGQTFGMNLNAMDMLKAEKPDEIFQMFENAMLDTGRSFNELSRFEKQIMVQQTGMSAESLKALMNYRKAGYTFEEAREKMEENDPTVIMKESLATFQDTVKEFRKVMNSNSFFEALSKGFMQKLTYHGETRKTLMMLSKGYEGLYESATKIDAGTITKLVRPINYIIDTMRRIFSDPAFIKGVTHILNGIGELLSNSFSLTPEEVIEERVQRSLESTDFSKIEDPSRQKEIMSAIRDTLHHIDDSEIEGTILAKAKPASTYEDLSKLGISKVLNVLARKANISHKDLMEFLNKIKIPVPEFEAPKKTGAEGVKEHLQAAADEGGSSLGAIAKITGKVGGILVKGAIIGLTALLKLMSKQIDKVDLDSDKSPGLMSMLLGISKEEMDKLMGGLGDAIGGLFSKGGKLFGMGTFIVGQMLLLFKDAAFFLADIFAIAIKSAFGIKMKASDMSFRQASIYFPKEPATLEKNEKSELFKETRRYGIGKDAVTAKAPYVGMIKNTDTQEKILQAYVAKLAQIKNSSDATKEFTAGRLDELIEQFNNDKDRITKKDVLDVLNFNLSEQDQNASAQTQADPSQTAAAARDFSGMFGLDDLHAKSQMTFMDSNNKMIDLDDKSRTLGQTDGVVSVMLRMTENVVDDLQEISALTGDVYKANTYAPKKDKSMLKSKVEELSKRIDKSIEEMKKDETLQINPVMSREDILSLAKGLAKNNVVKIFADPQYAAGGYYLDLANCKHTSDNEGSFSSPRLNYNT